MWRAVLQIRHDGQTSATQCQAPRSKIFRFTGILIYGIPRLSPCRHEGRFAIVTKRGAGCDGRLRRQCGLNRADETPQRTAKSCGPGAATVASIPAGLCWRGNGDNKGRSPGRSRISRKPIARGKPGCPGCTRGLIRVLFSTGLPHTELRAQSAPGFPCALCQREGQRDGTTRAKTCRGNEGPCFSRPR